MRERSLKNQIITIVIVVIAIFLAIKILPFVLKSFLLPIKLILIVGAVAVGYYLFTKWRND